MSFKYLLCRLRTSPRNMTRRHIVYHHQESWVKSSPAHDAHLNDIHTAVWDSRSVFSMVMITEDLWYRIHSVNMQAYDNNPQSHTHHHEQIHHKRCSTKLACSPEPRPLNPQCSQAGKSTVSLKYVIIWPRNIKQIHAYILNHSHGIMDIYASSHTTSWTYASSGCTHSTA